MTTNNIDSNCKEVAQECRASSCGGMIEVSELADDNVCASCGIAALDNVKLKKCTCDLVKYCSDECREDHLLEHEEECKEKMNELHDKKLFTQPDSSCFGECPICFLPMPIDPRKSTIISCCSKLICRGCEYANEMSNGSDRCPFCRERVPDDDDEVVRRMMKRVEANDPVALSQMGARRYEEGDHKVALKHWKAAAQSGGLIAHFKLGCMYWKGGGVEKDEEKAVYHYERAAIVGHPYARRNLGCIEEMNGRGDRAVKHYNIAAKLGDDESMKALWRHYKHGNITKDDLEATLRAHHAAIGAMKSPQREAAEAFYVG